MSSKSNCKKSCLGQKYESQKFICRTLTIKKRQMLKGKKMFVCFLRKNKNKLQLNYKKKSKKKSAASNHRLYSVCLIKIFSLCSESACVFYLLLTPYFTLLGPNLYTFVTGKFRQLAAIQCKYPLSYFEVLHKLYSI